MYTFVSRLGVIVCVLCTACGESSVRASFRAVSDPRQTETVIGADYASVRDVPDYITREGRLYLITETYSARRPRADAVLQRRWTCSEVSRLKRSPDARALLPNARALDGGIRWSECSQFDAPRER